MPEAIVSGYQVPSLMSDQCGPTLIVVVGLATDLTGILWVFFEAAEVGKSVMINLPCFEEVQQATAEQLVADRPSDPAAPLIYRSGLSEDGLSLMLHSAEQCCLLASALMAMLSHLLRLGPGLSLSALTPHTPGLMLELLGIGNLDLQAAVLDVFALLLDMAWWTYDILLNRLLERTCMLASAQEPSGCDEVVRAHLDSSILALLHKLVSSKVRSPIPETGSKCLCMRAYGPVLSRHLTCATSTLFHLLQTYSRFNRTCVE